MKKSFIILFVLTIGNAMNYVSAAEYVVTQEGMKFSEIFLKIEHDDTIKFVNLDSVTHKLKFVHRKFEALEAELIPGDSQAVLFSKPGIYDVMCHDHPEMRMTVFVPHIDVVLNQ